jgi:hypothetical protein
MARKSFLIALVVSVFAIMPPARALVFTGTCVIGIDFEFSTPLRSVTNASAPRAATSYEASIYGAADLNPLAGGTQACVVDNTPTSPFKGTSGFLSGNAISWTCEAAVGTGEWQQDWDPDPGVVIGDHEIAGPWGGWVLAVHNADLSVTGTVNLKVAPADQTKLAECETRGISNLSMIGIMHFQDPPPVTG